MLSVLQDYNSSSETASAAFGLNTVNVVSSMAAGGLFNVSKAASDGMLEVIEIVSDRAASDLLVPGEAAQVYTADSCQVLTSTPSSRTLSLMCFV
jgi:hypothetical protein